MNIGHSCIVSDAASPPAREGRRETARNSRAELVLAQAGASNSGSYLTDLAMANKFAKATTTVVTAAGTKLSDAFVQAIKDNNQAGVIFLEGRKVTTEPLVVEVRDDGDQPVLQITLPLEIMGVEQMYGHLNLRPEAGGPGGDGDRYTDLDTGTPPKSPCPMGVWEPPRIWSAWRSSWQVLKPTTLLPRPTMSTAATG